MDNPYVLVVHGTWNPPTDPPTWHQKNDDDRKNFCTAINEILESRYGLGRPVWRGDAGTSFAWSGANRHEDRVAGAQQLLARIDKIVASDPNARIHLIGHSHGCNVILKCVEQYLARVREAREALSLVPRRAPSPGERWLRIFKQSFQRHIRNPDLTGLSSDATIRLGRIVFLGPVFFKKHWFEPSLWSLPVLLGRAFNLLFSIAIGASIGYLVVLYFWTFVALFSHMIALLGVPALSWPHLDPREWHWSLYIIAGLYLIALTMAIFGPISGLGLRNVNLYFDEEVAGLHTGPSAERSELPLECLVITAGCLDEVLLAFSAEPLVYGTLVPQIRHLTRSTPRLSMPPRPSGLADLPNRWALRFFSGIALWIRSVVLSSARPFVKVFERQAVNFMLKIISAPAYGLPPIEFEDAAVKASADLDLEKHFAVTTFDAQEALMRAPLLMAASGDSNRYRFVVDKSAMELKIQESWLVAQMEQTMDDLFRRVSAREETRTQMHEDFKRTCVILEERLKEFSGAVQLTHSSYYTNDHIIDRVADFIAVGPAPTGASDQQDVVGV